MTRQMHKEKNIKLSKEWIIIQREKDKRKEISVNSKNKVEKFHIKWAQFRLFFI